MLTCRRAAGFSGGWVIIESRFQLKFDIYCDSADELRVYAEARKLHEAEMPYKELEERRCESDADGQVAWQLFLVSIPCRPVVRRRCGLASNVFGLRLAREDVGSVDAILFGGVFFFRAAEAVEVRGYPDLFKADGAEPRHELCLRQSACDSIGPESNVAFGLLAQWCIERDVSEEQSSAMTEDAPNFSEGFVFFSDEV